MNDVFIITIVKETCCNCGIVFGMEKEYQQQKLDSGDTFCCPNGHKQHYAKSTVAKQREEIERLKKDNRYCQLNSDYLRRSRASLKGHLNRIKKQKVEK